MRTRLAFSASLLLFSMSVAAQECSSHIVVDPFDQKTSLGIDNLKAEDFDVHLGGAAVPVLSATQNFNNRVLVLLETSGSSEDEGISQMVRRVAELARRAPNSRRIAFGVFGERALIADTFSATRKNVRRASTNSWPRRQLWENTPPSSTHCTQPSPASGHTKPATQSC